MSNNKSNSKKLFYRIAWLLGACVVIGLLIAAVHHKNVETCKGLNVRISSADNNFFIDKHDVEEIVNQVCGSKVNGRAVSTFNLRLVENILEEQIWINNAELYLDNNNVLQVDIDERVPIARLFSKSGSSFYIDSTNKILPIGKNQSTKIPVFTGFPYDNGIIDIGDTALLNSVKLLSTAIIKDDFLSAMIEQIDITSEKKFEMIPKVGNHIILFGTGDNVEKKFFNLKLFYKNLISKAGWTKYSAINLQFDNQIVAKLRGKEDYSADSLRALQLMELMVANASKNSNDSLQKFFPEKDRNPIDSSLIDQSIEREDEPETKIGNNIYQENEPLHSDSTKVIVTLPKPTQTSAKPQTLVKPNVGKAITPKATANIAIKSQNSKQTKPNNNTQNAGIQNKQKPKNVMPANKQNKQ